MSETVLIVDEAPRGTSALLTGMALGNVDQAARLIRINASGMALWHLREAIQQLEQAEQFCPGGRPPCPPASKAIDTLNAATTPEPNGKQL